MSQYCRYLTYLGQMDSLQRALFLINLRKALTYYSQLGLRNGLGTRKDEQAEYQIKKLLTELELAHTGMDTYQVLKSLEDLLLVTSASMPMQATTTAAAGLPRQLVPPQLPRNRLSIVINLDAIVALVFPLLVLTLKLAFLLWIFARHASPGKRLVLFVMAGLWIAWEAYLLQRRLLVVPAPNAPPRRHQPRQPQQQPPQQPPLQPGQANAQQAPAQDQRQRRRRPRPTSRLSPRFWINSIAAFGLAEEARELGLTPRSIAGRPIAPAPPSPNPRDPQNYTSPVLTPVQARRRSIRNVIVAFVLFFGTLSPEIERKRKKAIEKRDKLLVQKQEARERRAARRRQTASETDQPGPDNDAQAQQNENQAGAASPQSPTSGGEDDTDLERRAQAVVDDEDDEDDEELRARQAAAQQEPDQFVAIF